MELDSINKKGNFFRSKFKKRYIIFKRNIDINENWCILF